MRSSSTTSTTAAARAHARAQAGTHTAAMPVVPASLWPPPPAGVDAERLTWCSRRTERTSLLAYGSLRVWEGKVIPAIKNLKNVNVAAVPQDVLETLAKDMPRVIKWDVMISEGTIFVTDDRGQHEVQLQWLTGERG